MLGSLVLGLVALTTPAHASVRLDQEPPAAQSQAVAASLLTPAQARRATGFGHPLAADVMAGEAGRSCYGGEATWTCDGWFTTDRTSTPYPVGVGITVAGSKAQARQALAALAAKSTERTGDRVLTSTPGLLVTYSTGLAVGPNLLPAVSVAVARVKGSSIVMGSCQVEQRRLSLRQLRNCAGRLQRAQGQRFAGLVQG